MIVTLSLFSVGYRIKSKVATKFRQWATGQLREYIVKGFLLDIDCDNVCHNSINGFLEELRLFKRTKKECHLNLLTLRQAIKKGDDAIESGEFKSLKSIKELENFFETIYTHKIIRTC